MPNQDRSELRKEAFEALFEQNRSAVFAYFLAHLGNREDAKDQTQETFSRVWSRIDDVIALEPERRNYWIFGVAKNVVGDFRRRATVRAKAAEKLNKEAEQADAVCLTEAAQHRMDLAEVDEAIAHLPEARRLILTMSVIGGMNSAEIGEIMGRPAGTVRSELSEARRQLREMLEARISL